ncbi:MAG TPA: hypothetical protein VF168_05650 [Trueperaceae bacterium]
MSLPLSPWNSLPEVRQRVAARDVFLCDCTLREGEQSAGAAFSLEKKIELAHRLDDIGIKQIQVGYPGVSEEDKQIVKTFVAEGFRAKIESISMIHVPNWRHHVEAGLECGVDIVSMQFGISDIRLERVLRTTRAEVLQTISEAVRYAKEQGAFVSFSPTDATRADPDFLIEVVRTLEEAGVDRLRVTDSMGACGPTGFRAMVEAVVGAVDVPVGVHVHNDFGLAMANVCASVEAGAHWVDCVVNGLGERSGNVSLDEVAMTLEHIYDFDTGIHLGRLTELARQVERMAQVPLAKSKPVVGENAFAHQLDNHIRGVLADPAVYEPFPPELVGNQRRFPLGRLSGKYAVTMKLREFGVDPEALDIEELVDWTRSQAERQGGSLSDDAFRTRVEEMTSSAKA